MPSRPIPRDQWASFLDSFSRSHEGWLSTLEVAQEGAAPMVKAHDLPLLAMTCEHAGDDDYLISIDLGARGETHVNHVVRDPIDIGVDMTPHGEDEGLRIAASREVTRLRFRVAALPESLDGIVISGP